MSPSLCHRIYPVSTNIGLGNPTTFSTGVEGESRYNAYGSGLKCYILLESYNFDKLRVFDSTGFKIGEIATTTAYKIALHAVEPLKILYATLNPGIIQRVKIQ